MLLRSHRGFSDRKGSYMHTCMSYESAFQTQGAQKKRGNLTTQTPLENAFVYCAVAAHCLVATNIRYRDPTKNASTGIKTGCDKACAGMGWSAGTGNFLFFCALKAPPQSASTEACLGPAPPAWTKALPLLVLAQPHRALRDSKIARPLQPGEVRKCISLNKGSRFVSP